MKKLALIFLIVSLLGAIGWSLAAAPVGTSAQKAAPSKKSSPPEKGLPAEKNVSEGQPAAAPGAGEERTGPSGDGQRLEAFKSSLHHTGRGLAFYYGKEQQGLELLTGQPYEKLACKQCHIGSCQGCHQPVKKTKGQPDRLGPVDQKTCLQCHDRLAVLQQKLRESKKEDVHAALGMTCLDCHTAREMHGDGNIYQSQKQPEAMDARCENCHTDIANTYAHRKHYQKISCQACHAVLVANMISTQWEPLAGEGKRLAVPVADWIFLVGRGEKMTAAALETFVTTEGKTFLRFTPDGSHAVARQGRPCGECHGSTWMLQTQQGKVRLSWEEKGAIQKGKGVIPGRAGIEYGLVHQRFEKGKWTTLEPAGPALVQYAGWSGPVSDKHFRKMLKFKSEEPEGKDKKKKK
jgi:hypothetical protein